MFNRRKNAMPNQYTPEFKKHHVEAWRASGMTRHQYCEIEGLIEGTFKKWPSQINPKLPTNDEIPTLLPVTIARPAAAPPITGPVTVHLPGGVKVDCQPAQLTDVIRALNRAQA